MTTVYEQRAEPASRLTPAGAVLALLWGGAAAVIALWWTNTDTVAGTDGWLTGAGRIAGLLGGYSCAVLVGLMARVPVLERRVGSDRVARWHAMAGRYTICLVIAHAVLITAGYAAREQVSLLEEARTIIFDYPEMISAAFGTVILIAVGITSARAARRKLSYEFWYYVHLLTYLGIYLAFWHQLRLGNEIHPREDVWRALYGGVAALVLWFRVLAPVWLNLRHRLRVESVHKEAPGVYSVVVTGRHLNELGARPGQFFRWRFLAKGLCWTSTPYSLSAPPRPDRMRITVKALGDHSTAVPRLRPGTRVWAEGPYGSLTVDRRTAHKSLLIAAGVGITPLRALFETLPGEVTLLYRARTVQDLALGGELDAIARWRGARVLYALNGPDGQRPNITTQDLKASVPDLVAHDVYICGPHAFAQEVYRTLRAAGVPDRRIHHESFEL
ncbi:ferredoxin reductase family protein [Streptomyces blattellae]|uniref:ferredoxin reductase family protein n=1 Tax=Streptomyces blattellae TaxID=2569855 RepID=UPI0012B7A1F1|nr:ferric reductase-like transmembrane domain-containing protein [Streptomyces blattellae]